MPNCDSVTLWIKALRSGDDDAANELWERYFSQLMRIARSRMSALPRTTYDEEDVAISTFRVLCHKLREGRYPELSGRDELWHLMLKVLVRKVMHRAEYECAQKRRVPLSLSDYPDDIFGATGESASFVVAAECEELFARLNDSNLEQVVLWKLEGFSDDEIARKINRTRRTVQRMLSLIRNVWTQENDGPFPPR